MGESGAYDVMLHVMGAGEVLAFRSGDIDHETVDVQNVRQCQQISKIALTSMIFPRRKHIGLIPLDVMLSMARITTLPFEEFMVDTGSGYRQLSSFGIKWRFFTEFEAIYDIIAKLIGDDASAGRILRLWWLWWDHISLWATADAIQRFGELVAGLIGDAGFQFAPGVVTPPREFSGLMQRVCDLGIREAVALLGSCTSIDGVFVVEEMVRHCKSPAVVLAMLGGMGTVFSTVEKDHAGAYSGRGRAIDFADASDEMRELARVLGAGTGRSDAGGFARAARLEGVPYAKQRLEEYEAMIELDSERVAKVNDRVEELLQELGDPALAPIVPGSAELRVAEERLTSARDQMRAAIRALAERKTESVTLFSLLPRAPEPSIVADAAPGARRAWFPVVENISRVYGLTQSVLSLLESAVSNLDAAAVASVGARKSAEAAGSGKAVAAALAAAAEVAQLTTKYAAKWLRRAHARLSTALQLHPEAGVPVEATVVANAQGAELLTRSLTEALADVDLTAAEAIGAVPDQLAGQDTEHHREALEQLRAGGLQSVVPSIDLVALARLLQSAQRTTVVRVKKAEEPQPRRFVGDLRGLLQKATTELYLNPNVAATRLPPDRDGWIPFAEIFARVVGVEALSARLHLDLMALSTLRAVPGVLDGFEKALTLAIERLAS